MSRVVVVNHVTLDGVMQSPSGLDEDPRDGFAVGGWARPYGDEVLGRFMGERMSGGGDGAMLFGRRTYETMASFWPEQTDGNPFTEVLNARQKYVASRTLEEPLDWVNSTVLEGDAADAVAALKQERDGSLVILGSGKLIESLMPAGLIDEWVLTIHPLVLGKGRRLFPDGVATLKLTSTTPTTSGVIIATYETQR